MIEAHNINEHAQAPALHLALAASQALAAAGRAESDAATLRRRLRFCRRRGLTPPAGYFKVHLPPAEHAAMLAASRRAMALDAASAPHTHNVSTSDGSALADDPHHPAYAGPSSAALPIAPAMAEALRVLLLPDERFEALRASTRAAARPGAAGESADVPAAAGPGDVKLVADALKRLAGIMLRRYPASLASDEARLAAAAAPGGAPLPPRLHAALLARIPEQRCLERLRAWAGTPAAAAALAAAPAAAWAAATAAARAAAEAEAAAESSGSEGEEEEYDEEEEDEEEQACARDGSGGGGGGGARKRPRGGGPPAPAAAAEPFSFNFRV